MMLNDYECAKHGIFECSHPICPTPGCASANVKKVFTKVNTKSEMTSRTDAGMRRSAEMYNQSDWKTAHEGESSKANNRAAELKWGDDAASFLGGNLETALPRGPADGVPSLGLVQANGAAHQLASAERIGVKKQDDAWAGQLAAAAKEARAK